MWSYIFLNSGHIQFNLECGWWKFGRTTWSHLSAVWGLLACTDLKCMHVVTHDLFIFNHTWIHGMLVPVAHAWWHVQEKNQHRSFAEWQGDLLTVANGWYVGWCWVNLCIFYLYNSSGTKIPDSWYSCMKEFSRDLRTAVAADESVVAEYMQVRSSAM